MPQDPIFVTQPAMPPLAEFLPFLEEIWASRVLTNVGPMHDRLETALRGRLGVDHISLFANGTMALATAIRALGLRGEVITTPYSFVATTHALVWAGLDPVFVDIDRHTLTLDPARIEDAITPRTSAILAVHCYGMPCDTAAIGRIAAAHRLRVIYDAAHAFGVRTATGNLLAHGDCTVLSFHATKVFTTFEGGALVTHDAATKGLVDRLRNHGIVDEVTVTETGCNGKMSEIAAAFGLLQLRHLDAALGRRADVDRRYRAGLAGVAGIECAAAGAMAGSNHSYFPILVGDDYPLDRDALHHHLKAHGIHGRRYFHPLISAFPMYRSLPSAAPARLPVAGDVSARVLCLPIHADLPAAAVDRIVALIADPG